MEILQAANIQDISQTTGSLVIKAFGDVPTVDVTIRIIFYKGVELTQNAAGMDVTPTAGSTNAVQSNGLKAAFNDIWKTIYPVGSIYMSVNSTSPQTLFGGT